MSDIKDMTLNELSHLVAERLHRLSEKDNGDQYYVIMDVFGCVYIMKESDGPQIVFSYKGEVQIVPQRDDES